MSHEWDRETSKPAEMDRPLPAGEWAVGQNRARRKELKKALAEYGPVERYPVCQHVANYVGVCMKCGAKL
jgi:hypothetical protein